MAIDYTFIWWDELDGKDMPALCIQCGKKAKWYAFEFTTSRGDWKKKVRVKRTTNIPFCLEHRGKDSVMNMAHLHTSGSTKEGVWVYEVSNDFLNALKKHRKQEIEAWKEENDGADPADFEDARLPPGLRKEPVKPDKSFQKNPIFWLFGGLLAVVLLVFLCGGCGMAAMMIFGMTR
jgi:hypothetical protein